MNIQEQVCKFDGFPDGQPLRQTPEGIKHVPVVVTIDPTGEVTGLKRDEFSLSFLGKQEVSRASTIEYDMPTDSWGIKLVGKYATGGPEWPFPNQKSLGHFEATGFKTYEEARKAEVVWIEHCHEQSIQPLSYAGLSFLRGYRGMA